MNAALATAAAARRAPGGRAPMTRCPWPCVNAAATLRAWPASGVVPRPPTMSRVSLLANR